MSEPPLNATRQQRLLECWLPLAQQVMLDIGWRASPAELEALILAAARDLAYVDSASTARAVLWTHYLRQRSEQL